MTEQMLINETHKSLDDVPPYPMFGQERKQRASSASGQLNEALTNSIAVALAPNQVEQRASSNTSSSPTKTA